MNGDGRTGFAGVESVWNGYHEAVGIAFAWQMRERAER